jgi:hypothetical protein
MRPVNIALNAAKSSRSVVMNSSRALLSSSAASSILFDRARFASSSSISMDIGTSRNYSRNLSDLNIQSLKYEQATSYHYNSSLERFMAVEDWKSVFTIMKQMGDAGLEPNLWKVAHGLKESSEDEKVWTEFVTVVSKLREQGLLQKNEEAFSFAMSTCSQYSWPKLVIQLFEEMKHLGLVQQWAYLEVLNAYIKEKDYISTKNTVHEMLKLYKLGDGDYCDVHRLAMETFIENDRWQDALNLFQEMDASEGRRDISCYKLALKACVVLREPDLALKFQKEIHASSLIPDDVCYKYVIQCCAEAGYAQEAGNYYIEFSQKKFSKAPRGSWICSTSETTWQCFEIAFGSCISSGNLELAEKVLSNMCSLLEAGGKQSPPSPKSQVQEKKISDADLDRLRNSVSKMSEGSKFDFDLFIKSRLEKL